MADSKHMKILEASRAVVIGLDLLGIADRNCKILDVLQGKGKWIDSYPCCELAPSGRENISPTAGTNLSDDFGWPVFIALIDAANQEIDLKKLDQRLLWREKVVDAFIHRRLTVDGVGQFDCTIEPSGVVDSRAWFDRNLYVSPLLVRVHSRERRRA